MKSIKRRVGVRSFLVLPFFIVLSFYSLLQSQEPQTPAKDPNAERQLKIKITSPKPGQTLKGKVQILWEVETSCHSPNEEKKVTQDGTTQKEKYVAQYFVDYQLIGENTTDDPAFELDTKLYKNGIHTITVNAGDDHPHVATYAVKVRFKN